MTALVASVVLSACGGGSGGGGEPGNGSSAGAASTTPTASTKVAKYVGKWVGCLADPEAGFSQQASYEFSAKAADQLDFKVRRDRFASADCTGAPTGGYMEGSGVLTFPGDTKVIQGETTDKVIYYAPNISVHAPFSFSYGASIGSFQFGWALLVDGSTLRVADFLPSDPADKYPTTLNPGKLTRQ